MTKIKRITIVVGISAMAIMGCKGSRQEVVTTDKTAEISNDTKMEESSKDKETSGGSESKSASNEEWVKLRAGESMEVNLEAKHGFIDSFSKNGNDMYKAMAYNGELVTENAYCYFFSRYFEKGSDVYSDMKFTGNLDDVAEDIWSNGMAFWESSLGQKSGSFLNSSTLEIEVKSRERVTLNGNEFLREEVLGKSASMGVP